MKLYHSTTTSNLKEIKKEGLVPGAFGVVYFAESALLAAAFDVIHNGGEGVVIEVELREDQIEESFDHSQRFFQAFINRDSAKCYMFEGCIEPEEIDFSKVESVVDVIGREG